MSMSGARAKAKELGVYLAGELAMEQSCQAERHFGNYPKDYIEKGARRISMLEAALAGTTAVQNALQDPTIN